MDQLTATTDLLHELIAYPTISADSNLEMINALATRLEDAGARVEILRDDSGTKANLFATIGPERDGGIVLSGHTDVVPVDGQDWSGDPFQMTLRDDRLFGRGTCDMKGFIAACVTMAPTLASHVRDRPLHFAFTYDEEVGCLGAQALATTLRGKGITPGVAIIGEPTNMRIIEGHKGCCEYTTHFHGLAGHGSTPERGVNAVEYAVRYVMRLLELRVALHARAPKHSLFTPPWTTINPGQLTGGVAHNVIAETASVAWEMRPVQDSDASFVKAEMQRYVAEVLLPDMQRIHPQSAIRTDIIGEVAGLEPADENEARDIVAELTGANGADVVSFGTEAGIFRELGMSAVVCGPGSIEQAHKADEFIALDQMAQCLTMLEGLSAKLANAT